MMEATTNMKVLRLNVSTLSNLRLNILNIGWTSSAIT